MDLQEALGAPVDVVREKGLRSQVRARVLAEAVPLCETTAPGFRNRARKLFDGRSSRRRLFARARERSRYGQSGHARKRISFPF